MTIRSVFAAAGDMLLWLLIVVVGAVALSPLAGLAAARETIAARRRLRDETAAMPSGLWARQMRRNASLPAWRRSVESAVNPGP